MTQRLRMWALAGLTTLGTLGVAHADQPHMEAALKSLQQAREQLAQASNDKGGHRAKALQAVDNAIEQVKKGMAYDRSTLSPGEKR